MMLSMDVVCVHVGLIDGSTDDSDNYERNVQELAEELKKPNPRASVVKQLMKLKDDATGLYMTAQV